MKPVQLHRSCVRCPVIAVVVVLNKPHPRTVFGGASSLLLLQPPNNPVSLVQQLVKLDFAHRQGKSG